MGGEQGAGRVPALRNSAIDNAIRGLDSILAPRAKILYFPALHRLTYAVYASHRNFRAACDFVPLFLALVCTWMRILCDLYHAKQLAIC